MIKENATKEYLAGKVLHYTEQGDTVMANKFMDVYLNRVGATRKEIHELVKTAQEKLRNKEKKTKGDVE
jgi:hypothetical protein